MLEEEKNLEEEHIFLTLFTNTTLSSNIPESYLEVQGIQRYLKVQGIKNYLKFQGIQKVPKDARYPKYT